MFVKSIHTLFSLALAYITTRCLTMMVLVPSFAEFTQDLNTEFVVAQVFLFLSFSLGFYLLIRGMFVKGEKKRFALLGMLMPVYVSGLSLLEKADTSHDYSDFWVILIGSIVLMVFTVPLVALFAGLEVADEDEYIKKPSTSTGRFVEFGPRIYFKGNQELTERADSLLKQLEEAKQAFSDIEVLHEVEKMEKQLLESRDVYESIGQTHKELADEKVNEILSHIEKTLMHYFNQYNEQQLHVLEKIIYQQQN